MASVYKREGSAIWQAAFYVPNPHGTGRAHVRKSTGKTSRKEALAAAIALEREELVKAGAGGGKARRIQAVLTRAGEEAVRETLNAARARQFLEEIVRISTGEEMPSFSIRTWFEEWLRRKTNRTSPATVARYRTSVKAFFKWLGDGADKPLESVTTTITLRFRDSLRSEGRVARTCNHYIRDIASGFRSAVVEGQIAYNPASGVEPLPLDDSITREPFTREEVTALIEAAETQDWKGVILIGAFTGLRLGDIALLKWGNVDLATGVIEVMPSKTRRKKKTVLIPLHAELRTFLIEHPISDDPEAPVFPTLARRSVSGKRGLSLTFAGIMNEANVSRGETREVEASENGEGNPRRVGRTVHARGFHSLRHTFTSWLANEDVPEEIRMLLTGHSDPSVHRGYTHTEILTLARSVEKLPGLVTRKNQ